LSLEDGNTDESSAVGTVISSSGSFHLSGEVPASLPSVPATGVAQTSHLDLSDRFLGVLDNSFTQPSVLAAEVAPVAFADAVVGDFGDPHFDGIYGNPLFYYF
jgi:hypothetical protein